MLSKHASAIVHSACSMLAFPKFTVEKVVPDNIRLFACSGSDGFEAALVVSVFSFGALDLHTPNLELPSQCACLHAPMSNVSNIFVQSSHLYRLINLVANEQCSSTSFTNWGPGGESRYATLSADLDSFDRPSQISG